MLTLNFTCHSLQYWMVNTDLLRTTLLCLDKVVNDFIVNLKLWFNIICFRLISFKNLISKWFFEYIASIANVFYLSWHVELWIKCQAMKPNLFPMKILHCAELMVGCLEFYYISTVLSFSLRVGYCFMFVSQKLGLQFFSQY